MTHSKHSQIVSLSLELLEDCEMSRTSVEGMVLKASRLARLVGDEETQSWLSYERFGYNDVEELSRLYLAKTSRWIDVEERKAYFAPLAVQEAMEATLKEQLDIVKKFIPSGQWASMQFQDQQVKASGITNSIIVAKRIVSAVRGEIQSFATRVCHEHLFSGQAETIFETYKTEVDALLLSKAGIAFDRMPKAFERLGAGDQESVSHALTTCRRVIDCFADSIFPASTQPFKIGDESIEVGERHTRNRLRAFIYSRMGKCSRYERLNKSLGVLYDRVSAGVHADVDTGEAKALVLQTYLFLGELLSLPGPN